MNSPIPWLKEHFLRAGYATLIWDKPGYGKSTGKFSREHLRQERAHILIDAIKGMKNDKGNQNFQVWLIPGADHNIILCETGCEKERNR